jgi:hypothetical protein
MKTEPRARRMWANYCSDGGVRIYGSRSDAKYFRGFLLGQVTPVAVIPLHDLTTLGDAMVSALRSIGVLPRARAKKGRK